MFFQIGQGSDWWIDWAAWCPLDRRSHQGLDWTPHLDSATTKDDEQRINITSGKCCSAMQIERLAWWRHRWSSLIDNGRNHGQCNRLGRNDVNFILIYTPVLYVHTNTGGIIPRGIITPCTLLIAYYYQEHWLNCQWNYMLQVYQLWFNYYLSVVVQTTLRQTQRDNNAIPCADNPNALFSHCGEWRVVWTTNEKLIIKIIIDN